MKLVIGNWLTKYNIIFQEPVFSGNYLDSAYSFEEEL